jgi:hypothetical protein
MWRRCGARVVEPPTAESHAERMSDESPIGRLVPRVLEFSADHFRTPPGESADIAAYHEPVAVGWRTTHWGLWLPATGHVVTITTDEKEAMARWLSIEHACEELGVLVDAIDPQRLRLRCQGGLAMTDVGSLPTAPAADGGEPGR